MKKYDLRKSQRLVEGPDYGVSSLSLLSVITLDSVDDQQNVVVIYLRLVGGNKRKVVEQRRFVIGLSFC